LLYQPERHLPITKNQWNAQVVEETISTILNRCLTDYTAEKFWPMPEDEWKGQTTTSIYFGAMGILWAIDYLQKYIASQLPFDKQELAESVYDKYFNAEALIFSKYSDADGVVPSYWLGETGILLVKSKLQQAQSEEIWNKQYSLIKNNMKNPTLEPLWGGTGTIIPALFQLEAGTSQRWVDLFVEHCEYMKIKLVREESLNCPIWIQDLYGKKRMLLGAGHGFVGNMYPFVRGNQFLPDALSNWALNTAVETVLKSAVTEGDCCNWASSIENTSEASPKYLVQWCHGAPGVIISLNDVPTGYSQEFDDVLIKAGEMIWSAGPLTKGVGICHGTDGNGYALLKLYTRTGDEKWLNRARRFAMHAIEQISGRYSLWEGDIGLACYLHACLSEDDRFPLLDVC
jgi:lantibiotic modifying enzyme